MNYELAKQLKEAGFKTKLGFPSGFPSVSTCDCSFFDAGGRHTSMLCSAWTPTLSELIAACGNQFMRLEKNELSFSALSTGIEDQQPVSLEVGTTPEEAVAKLWLALNKK